VFLPPQSNPFQSGWFHRFRYGPESQPERYSRKLSCCSCSVNFTLGIPPFGARQSAPCCFACGIVLVFLGFCLGVSTIM
jgi:hypothetical protein